MNKMPEKDLTATGLISGGLDSTVVAAYMSAYYAESNFLFIKYGQKTEHREQRAFRNLVEKFQPVRAEIVDLSYLRHVGSSALFEEQTHLNVINRKREYVPFRNAAMLAAAVALAESIGADHVLTGSTAGDTTCPDNSPEFIRSYQEVIKQGTMTDKPI